MDSQEVRGESGADEKCREWPILDEENDLFSVNFAENLNFEEIWENFYHLLFFINKILLYNCNI